MFIYDIINIYFYGRDLVRDKVRAREFYYVYIRNSGRVSDVYIVYFRE